MNRLILIFIQASLLPVRVNRTATIQLVGDECQLHRVIIDLPEGIGLPYINNAREFRAWQSESWKVLF
jgi:hypothetical protein